MIVEELHKKLVDNGHQPSPIITESGTEKPVFYLGPCKFQQNLDDAIAIDVGYGTTVYIHDDDVIKLSDKELTIHFNGYLGDSFMTIYYR